MIKEINDQKILAANGMVTVRDAPVFTAARIAKQNSAKLNTLHVLESASTDNRYLIKHIKTGEEIITGVEYEVTVKEEINKVYASVLTLWQL